MPPRVTACLCFGRSFAELKELADREGLHTVEEVASSTGCTTGCGLCRPYVRRMLRTGETEMGLIPPEEA